MQGSSLGLLRTPEVRKELAVTEEQGKQLDDLQASLQASQRAGGGGNFNREEFQKLSDEERQKRFAEMRQNAEKSAAEADEKLGKILDGTQSARLAQLRLQRDGTQALTQKKTAEQLGLSTEQQDKIRKIQESARPQAIFQNLSAEERREFFTKMQVLREKAQADTLAVLTDAQKAKFDELKGKPFEFPRPQFGGQGGQGGNGGQRQRPARSTNNN
jgi:hypothetical protein